MADYSIIENNIETIKEMADKGLNKRPIVYVDMDNVLVDFPTAFAEIPDEIITEYKEREDGIPGMFSKMKPVPGALEAYRFLAENFDTYILSTAPWNNPSAWSDKLEWVKRYLGDYAHKRLILSHHKNLNKGDFLIDDRTHNGAGDFEGELVLFGSNKFPNWDSVVSYFKEILMKTIIR